MANDLDDHNAQGKKDYAKQPRHHISVMAVAEQKRESKAWCRDQRHPGAYEVGGKVEQAQPGRSHGVYIHGIEIFGKLIAR